MSDYDLANGQELIIAGQLQFRPVQDLSNTAALESFAQTANRFSEIHTNIKTPLPDSRDLKLTLWGHSSLNIAERSSRSTHRELGIFVTKSFTAEEIFSFGAVPVDSSRYIHACGTLILVNPSYPGRHTYRPTDETKAMLLPDAVLKLDKHSFISSYIQHLFFDFVNCEE